MAAGPILIDARAAARAEVGGVERWARELADRLPRLRPGAYRVARPPRALAHRAGHAWEQAVLPVSATLRRAPLLLCPANLAPLAFTRSVVVLHDVAALRHPEWYTPGYVAWQRLVLPRVARRARAVVTVSEFSRREIGDTLGVDAVVIPGGVDGGFAAGADPGAAARALGLERPYVLTVATSLRRKNRTALGPAAQRLAERGIELVAAGGGRGYMRDDAAPPPVRDLGYVDEAHLPGLYAGARAFVLPSRHEGFGLTCLEAMASGVPVVAADAGALPETCDGAAVLVPPEPEPIAAALLALLDDPQSRERLVAAGRGRAAALTWDRTARAVDDLLARLAGQPARARGR
jgi:glycosyltransferase involved in cell wall biosynthesis